jgi:hypothetical protein
MLFVMEISPNGGEFLGEFRTSLAYLVLKSEDLANKYDCKHYVNDIYVAAPALEGTDIKPQEHIWWSSKLDWLCLNDNIETRDE